MKCAECGAEFSTLLEFENHNNNAHRVLTVSKNPLIMLLNLPDGCSPGRWEAAEAFAEAIAELRQKHLGQHFQFLPFSLEANGGGLNAILAVA